MPIAYIKEDVTVPPFREGSEVRTVDEDKLREACKDFESLFVQQVLKSMRKTVSKSDFFGGGPGGEIFESLFDQELSRSITNREGFGLGKILYQQMIQKLKGNDQIEWRKPLPVETGSLREVYRRENGRMGE